MFTALAPPSKQQSIQFLPLPKVGLIWRSYRQMYRGRVYWPEAASPTEMGYTLILKPPPQTLHGSPADDSDSEMDAPTVIRWPRRYYADVIAALLSSVITLSLAILSTGARPSNLSLLWHRGDLIPYYVAAKGMIENGWWTPNPDLGFPHVQDTSTFPTPDYIGFGSIKVMSIFTNDPFAAVNLYFLLSFPFVALAGFLLFRSARVSTLLSAILATAFALLPWHFERLQHLFLANYAFMALGLTLVGISARGIPDRNLPRTKRRLLLTAMVLAGIVVGLGGVYYAAFTTLLGGLVLAFQFLGGRRIRDSIVSVLTLLVVPTTTALAVIVIKLTGTTKVSGEFVRETYESVVFGGDLYSLFRVHSDGLGASLFPERLRELDPVLGVAVPEGDAQLNLVAVAATVLATLVLVLALVSIGGQYRRGARLIQRTDTWTLMYAVSISIFVIGGVGVLFAAYVSPSIRAWGRMSVGVTGIALVVFGLALTMWWTSARRRTLWILVVTAIGIVTILDPIVAPSPIAFAQGKAVQANLREYVATAEGALPSDCPVLEVPIGLYPEVPPAERQGYYEDLMPYLYSTDLRWSYGALQYTKEGRWAKDNLAIAPAQQVVLAKNAGFCALQLDMKGFKREQASVIRAEYASLLGAPVATSSNNRWIMFSLDRA